MRLDDDGPCNIFRMSFTPMEMPKGVLLIMIGNTNAVVLRENGSIAVVEGEEFHRIREVSRFKVTA